MNSIMPRLDLTDSVSIIFSLILLRARAEAAGPDEGGGSYVCGGGGEPVWMEAFTPGAKSFNHKRKLSFIKYLTDAAVFGCW